MSAPSIAPHKLTVYLSLNFLAEQSLQWVKTMYRWLAEQEIIEDDTMAGVRMYFEDGTYLIADSEGKYSYCGLKPITHVLKVDRSTLPKGALLDTTDTRNAGDPDSRFVDLRNGELHRADFHVRSCRTDVMGQIKARRATLGEISAPEVEKGDETPALILDSRKDTSCDNTRQAAEGAYREDTGSCRPPPRTSRKAGRAQP